MASRRHEALRKDGHVPLAVLIGAALLAGCGSSTILSGGGYDDDPDAVIVDDTTVDGDARPDSPGPDSGDGADADADADADASSDDAWVPDSRRDDAGDEGWHSDFYYDGGDVCSCPGCPAVDEGETCSQSCEGGGCTEWCAWADCSLECDGGGCSQGCFATGGCTAVCEGGGCPQACIAEDCFVVCGGGGCEQACTDSDNCVLSCGGGGCNQRCDGPGSCLLQNGSTQTCGGDYCLAVGGESVTCRARVCEVQRGGVSISADCDPGAACELQFAATCSFSCGGPCGVTASGTRCEVTCVDGSTAVECTGATGTSWVCGRPCPP
jgi:hypothetical protein